MEYFIDAFKKYAEFSGRATRTQYWMFILFFMIIYFVLALIDVLVGTMVLAFIFNIAAFLPSIAIAARRLHDTGRTGWWQLLVLIPLIGAIVLIVFFVQDSVGDNEYGPNPKAVSEA